jgi:hypothetical protein
LIEVSTAVITAVGVAASGSYVPPPLGVLPGEVGSGAGVGVGVVVDVPLDSPPLPAQS